MNSKDEIIHVFKKNKNPHHSQLITLECPKMS